jgi:hypothetical protein
MEQDGEIQYVYYVSVDSIPTVGVIEPLMAAECNRRNGN